jgi:hypothetical protein
MRFNMTTGKEGQEETVTIPATMVTASASERKFVTKKRVIAAVVAVSLTAIVVTGIVVGIWIFAEQQRLMLQYTINLTGKDGSKSTQDVSTNMDENVAQYHVVKDNTEWWIVEDFNRNIKVAKAKDQNGVIKCLVSGLDEALATKPADIVAPTVQDQKAEDAVSTAEMMTIAQNPVKDRSFLGKTAATLCANSPIYWTYKTCLNETTAVDTPERNKRAALACTPCGCGYKLCLYCGSIYYTYVRYSNGYMTCTWYYYPCPGYYTYLYRC